MSRIHFNDEELLSVAHGELPFARHLLRKIHLFSCSRCRSRAAELTNLARCWQYARDAGIEISPDRVQAARQDFFSRVQQHSSPSLPLLPPRWKVGALGFIAASLCCVLAAGVLQTWHPVSPKAPEPIAAASATRKRAAPPFVQLERRPIAKARPLTRPLTVVPQPALIDPKNAQIAMLWALHELSICIRGSVEVARTASGGLVARGVIDSPEQEAILTSKFRSVCRTLPLALELRTPSEINSSVSQTANSN
jgi:hypothetical protein